MYAHLTVRVALFLAIILWAVVMPMVALAANQYVIISAQPNSNDFASGKVLKASDSLEVPEGTVITLLGEDGSISIIRGPAKVLVTEEQYKVTEEVQKNRSVFERVTDLLIGAKPSTESLGVARSIVDGGEGNSLDPWSISIHASGQACVKEDQIILRRSLELSDIRLAVDADQGMKTQRLVWAPGKLDFELPPTIAKKAIELSVRGGDIKGVFILNRMPSSIELNEPMEVLGWMLDKNCRHQALSFLRNLAGKPH